MTKFRVYYNPDYNVFFIKRRFLFVWYIETRNDIPLRFKSLDSAKEYISNQNKTNIKVVHEE